MLELEALGKRILSSFAGVSIRWLTPWHPDECPTGLEASWAAEQTHLARGDGDPFVTSGVEPSQAQRVVAVDVHMLAAGEPPSTFIVPSAMGVRDVAIAIDSGELHAILVLECIASIASKTIHVQHIAGIWVVDEKAIVLGIPVGSVDVGHVDTHRRAVVGGDLVNWLEAKPEFRGRLPETLDVFGVFPVEIDRSIVAALQKSGPFNAPRIDDLLSRPDDVGTWAAGDIRAVFRQLCDKILVLTLDRLKLFHFTHQFREWDDLSQIGFGNWYAGFTLRSKKNDMNLLINLLEPYWLSVAHLSTTHQK